MAQSLNHKVDFVTKGTWFSGFDEYGNIMVGDQAFEFYSERNVNKNIQIPWNEVDTVVASVLFKGRWIPRIGFKTRENGTIMFCSRQKDARKLLQSINHYIPADRMVRSWTFFEVVRNNLKKRFGKNQ